MTLVQAKKPIFLNEISERIKSKQIFWTLPLLAGISRFASHGHENIPLGTFCVRDEIIKTLATLFYGAEVK